MTGATENTRVRWGSPDWRAPEWWKSIEPGARDAVDRIVVAGVTRLKTRSGEAMIPIIENARSRIEDLCHRFHVRRLDLFGSAARESDFGDDSDVDLIVDYDPAFPPPSLKDVFAFRDELSLLLGREVDLTMAGAVRNPFLRAAIERSRQQLHGA